MTEPQGSRRALCFVASGDAITPTDHVQPFPSRSGCTELSQSCQEERQDLQKRLSLNMMAAKHLHAHLYRRMSLVKSEESSSIFDPTEVAQTAQR